MRFRTLVAASAAASLSLSALATAALANGVVFDSLDGGTSSAAFAGGVESVISGTFNTKAAPVHVDVALLLRDRFPDFGEPGDTYTVSLDGGIPISDLSFDPIGGLNYANGASVDFQGPVIESATFALTGLPTAWTVKHYDQFASVALNPNSLYWIEVSVHSASEESVIEWEPQMTSRGLTSPATTRPGLSRTMDSFVIRALTRSHLTAPFRWRSTSSRSPRPGP